MAKMVAARSRKKEAGWRKHIKAQAGSGLSIGAYCRQHDLQAYGFYWWRRELARRDTTKSAAFVPVTVAAEIPVPKPGGQVEIVLPSDWRVKVTGPVDQRMLTEVLAVLSARAGGVGC